MSAIAIRRGPWRRAIRPLPAGVAAAAIGDVHGQLDLFEALTDALAEALAAAADATLVQLGDIVDRGPCAIAAFERARRGLDGVRFVTLMGNHEDRMIRAMLTGDDRELALWLQFGGDRTLAEAGVSPDDPDWAAAFVAVLGAEPVDWLVTLPKMARVGDLVFVHAGLDPAASLEAQEPETLMWTRRPWLESAGPYAEAVAVIHGHTPQPDVDLDHPHRINLDTGAFRSGVLSGLVVVGDAMRLVQAIR